MSSKARRVTDDRLVSPFAWKGAAPAPPRAAARPQPPAAPPAADAAPAPPPDDPGRQQEHLAALEREAFARGYAQGEQAGAEAAAQRGDAMLRRLADTLDELTALRARTIHQTERQMVQLALAVARRIVHREVSLDRDLLVAMARVALDRLGESARVTVRLNPGEYEVVTARHGGAWAGPAVTVEPDARIPPGGCRVESDFGTIEAGIDAQIHELARALLGEPEEVPHAGR